MSKVIVQAIGGLVFLLVFMGVILFVSAGTVDYWRAWVYLADFGLCVILITGYLMRYDQKLLASRVSAGPVAETQRFQQVIQSLASLFFIVLYVVSGLDVRFHWSTVPSVISVIGDVLVALGFLIVFLVFRENSFTSAIIEVSAEQKVVTTGPYRFIRHPMYAGAALLLICTPLALGSWVALPFPLPLIVVVVLRAIDEEKYLRANLQGYDAYAKNVRYRLIPYIW